MVLRCSRGKKRIKNGPKSGKIYPKLDISSHIHTRYGHNMASYGLFTYFPVTYYLYCHIPPHMGSNGRQIAVKRGFSCENLPCSWLQKIITRPIFDLEPCPIHQNDHIVHPYNLYNSDLLKFKIFSLKITNKWRNQPFFIDFEADFSTYL